ncbi:MAG: glycerol-3-phosphate dehydrogenase, partial [Thiotrichales bacterium]
MNKHNAQFGTIILPLYKKYLEMLESKFSGEVDSSLATRIVMATDSSMYEVIPQAVLFPRFRKDISLAFKLAQRTEFKSITFTARGGGTGPNGQSLNTGIIIDTSRYMNKMLDINLEEGWVEVEPGMVLGQLNLCLKPHDLFFAPYVSTENQATIGGMFNTDACGKGSRIYGRTSDHVLATEVILHDGTKLKIQSVDVASIQEKIINRAHLKSKAITGKVLQLVEEHKAAIKDKFTSTYRLTGYNLQNIHDEIANTFNLNYLLAGSEGTLAFVSKLKLRLSKIPKYREVIAIKYNDFIASLADTDELLKFKPSAIEAIDATVVRLAKQDVIAHKISNLFPKTDNENIEPSIIFVEFTEHSQPALDTAIAVFTKQYLKSDKKHILGFYHATNKDEINNFWDLRKKGVGLLANLPGDAQPVAFIEDTVVPPENLAAYVQDLCTLLDEYKLTYGMFGHLDVGCLHVRPALNLNHQNHRRLVPEITDKVYKLLKKYNGILWGEHGKGFRSEYVKDYFGEALWPVLQNIKQIFDPYNKLNPGKIIPSSDNNKKNVVAVAGPMRGIKTQFISKTYKQDFLDILRCNGNAACMDFRITQTICPSFKVTQNRIHSPKGRAMLLRHWLYVESTNKK